MQLEADFDAERWHALLEEERVTNCYLAPAAVRMLMKAGPERNARCLPASAPLAALEPEEADDCDRIDEFTTDDVETVAAVSSLLESGQVQLRRPAAKSV